MAETSKLETTASEACTRAGAFALLLSVALASIIPVWTHRKEGLIVGRYIALRLTLVAALDALDDDKLWQGFKLTNDTESMSLEQLVKIQINSSTLAPLNSVSPTEAKVPPSKPG
jgi:hypothetical protein